MKKLYFLLFLSAVLACSCSRDSLMDNESSVQPDLKKASSFNQGPIFQVSPDGADDTEALLAAFSMAKDAGKGAVVELLPGTFEVDWIEVCDFKGTLTGAGPEGSIITNIPDLSPDRLLGQNKVPALIKFVGGEVAVTNLSVRLTEGLPWLGYLPFHIIMFSDYSAGNVTDNPMMCATLDNIIVDGMLMKDYPVWGEGGPLIDYPYGGIVGVYLGPDWFDRSTISLRSNIDVTISNSRFSKSERGVYIWGLKKGNIDVGTKGGNMFSENVQGLVINENIGVNVKIWNNEFNVPAYHWNGIDLNTEGNLPFEKVLAVLGNYQMRYNVINNNAFSNGMGIWDAWRYYHPDDPQWMNITWQDNIFNALGSSTNIWLGYSLKNALFANNTIAGEATDAWAVFTGFWWLPPEDPNYMLSWTENCRFINNKLLLKDMIFAFDIDAKDNLLMGDLSQIYVWDFGINNRIIEKTNPNHANGTDMKEARNMMEKMLRKNQNRTNY